MLNLDTHILIASLADDLTDRERSMVVKENLAISDIVLWELAKLVEFGRVVMDLDSVAFRRTAGNPGFEHADLSLNRPRLSNKFRH